MKGKMKKIIAMVCAAIMVVSSITVHKQSMVRADENISGLEATYNNGAYEISWTEYVGADSYQVTIGDDKIETVNDVTYRVNEPETQKTIIIDAIQNGSSIAQGTIILRHRYSITYFLNDGINTESSNQVKQYGINHTIENISDTKKGYKFIGWNTKSDGTGTTYMEGTVYESNADLELYAVWEKEIYKIEYELAGGTLPTGKTNPVTYDVETDTITLANPERKGYTFTGWSGTDLDTAMMEVTIPKGSTGDRKYTATWSKDEYEIEYELAGGTLPTGKTNPVTYDVETDTIILVNPERKGYTFTGWSGTDLDTATMEVTIPKGSAGDRKYTATWSKDEYEIEYELAGGTLPTGKTNPVTYDVETDTIILVNPERKGYTFMGWTGTGLTVAAQTVTIPKGSINNRSYTATWKLNDIHLLSISKPDNKTATVTWKMTNPDSDQTYEVYLDGKLVKSSLKECKYTISNIKTGSHQIKVVAVHNLEKIVKSTGLTKSFNVTTTLTVKKSGKVFKYLLGLKSSYALPVTHSDFIKKYPELNNSGYVFSGWYKGTKKVTSIKEDTELMTKWRMLKTRFKNVKVSKGKVKLTFNSTDWKNVDGIKITYSRTKNFKNKKSVIVKTNKKTMKSYTFKNANKKFKNGALYYFKVQFYYYKGSKKVIYKGNNVSKWIWYYKK